MKNKAGKNKSDNDAVQLDAVPHLFCIKGNCSAFSFDTKASGRMIQDTYEVGIEDAEADFGGETEITVSFSVSVRRLALLTGFKQQGKISVGYFAPETLAVKNAEMYVEGFKSTLVILPEKGCGRCRLL